MPLLGYRFAKVWASRISGGISGGAFVAHQLRYTTITRIADEVGLEAAQRVTGHADAVMTEHYARIADRQAIDAVKRLG